MTLREAKELLKKTGYILKETKSLARSIKQIELDHQDFTVYMQTEFETRLGDIINSDKFQLKKVVVYPKFGLVTTYITIENNSEIDNTQIIDELNNNESEMKEYFPKVRIFIPAQERDGDIFIAFGTETADTEAVPNAFAKLWNF